MANIQQENQLPELPRSKNTVIARNAGEICLRPSNDVDGGFTIDAADFELVRNHSWWVRSNGYMAAKIGGREIKLHHHLMGRPPAGQVCDHINRNKMRNTRDNLRFVSIQENNQNKNLYANNTTGYRGVFRYKNKFMAQVKHGGRIVYSKVDEPENEHDAEPEAQQ
jgi:hypothetical protein